MRGLQIAASAAILYSNLLPSYSASGAITLLNYDITCPDCPGKCFEYLPPIGSLDFDALGRTIECCEAEIPVVSSEESGGIARASILFSQSPSENETICYGGSPPGLMLRSNRLINWRMYPGDSIDMYPKANVFTCPEAEFVPSASVTGNVCAGHREQIGQNVQVLDLPPNLFVIDDSEIYVFDGSILAIQDRGGRNCTWVGSGGSMGDLSMVITLTRVLSPNGWWLDD